MFDPPVVRARCRFGFPAPPASGTVPGMDAILEPLVASPALPRYVEALEHLLADERARRERFYEEMSEQQKVEFINGEIFVHSPVKIRRSNAVGSLFLLLKIYTAQRDLGWVDFEKNLVCLTRNDYEPDVVFFGREKAALLQPDQMKLPAPDFIAEVLSPSTESHDRGVKFDDYAAHGVTEYWIIDPVANAIEQYALKEGGKSEHTPTYRQLGAWTGDALVASVAIPGFQVPARAFFEPAANLAALAAFHG